MKKNVACVKNIQCVYGRRGVADEHVRKANNELFCAKDYESVTKTKSANFALVIDKSAIFALIYSWRCKHG